MSRPKRPAPATAPSSAAAPAPRRSPRIDPAVWSTIAERSQFESLRDLACEFGVSHETIRAVVQRGSAAERAAITIAAD